MVATNRGKVIILLKCKRFEDSRSINIFLINDTKV